MECEVRQPHVGAPVIADRFEQQLRAGHPLERVQTDEWNARH